jgi:lipopolysaccharide transport system ATP-binding protein
MSKTILKIEKLSKQYRLGQVGTGTLADDLKRWWFKVLGKEDPFLKIGDVNNQRIKGVSDYVWAIKDINFEVRKGEVLGIIGKNGAGKSTLLKILSKITSPTTGSIKSRGRIASLLEVGTGFHGEMTGKENIFLNGAILGMTKKEISKKYDEIVEFSGCERYIDTPVKRYSSGMTVRLAFAVAAFLEPDILIIDEVLAVGDAEFQKKAIGKMQDISKGEGRTVLFVSHNMAAVRKLCTRCIVLENGEVILEGKVNDCIDEYLTDFNYSAHRKWDLEERPGSNLFKLIAAKVLDPDDNITLNHLINKQVSIEFSYEVLNNNELYTHSFNLFNTQNIHVFSSHDKDSITLKNPVKKGVYTKRVEIPANFLAEGGYACSFAIIRYNPFYVEFHEMDVLGFNIIDVVDENTARGNYSGNFPGVVRPLLNWH